MVGVSAWKGSVQLQVATKWDLLTSVKVNQWLKRYLCLDIALGLRSLKLLQCSIVGVHISLVMLVVV